MLVMNFDEWVQYGIDNDFCGPIVCYTHDDIPLTEGEEYLLVEEGEDPCIHIMRPYGGHLDIKREVEFNHAPSRWRKHG